MATSNLEMFAGVAKKPQHLGAPIAANIAKLAQLLNKKPRQFAGAKRRGTDWSACMKNRHRVCQVVSKLVCSRAARRKILKQGAADRSEHRQAGGVADPLMQM